MGITHPDQLKAVCLAMVSWRVVLDAAVAAGTDNGPVWARRMSVS